MLTSSENFDLRFLFYAVLLVAYAECADDAWKFYAANGTLVDLKLGNTYGLFNITGDQLSEKIITYGENSKDSEDLQRIDVLGYVNGVEDLGKQSELAPERDLCSVLKRMADNNDDDYTLRYITTTLLLDGADECPIPSQDKFLISRGFMSTFRLDPKYQLSCSEPWKYRLVMKRNSDTVLEAVFQMEMKPLYSCQSQ